MDIMQNGNYFWFIDMATASESALKECIPKGKLKNERKLDSGDQIGGNYENYLF